MKRTSRKLPLRTSTIRTLQSADLSSIQGGLVGDSVAAGNGGCSVLHGQGQCGPKVPMLQF